MSKPIKSENYFSDLSLNAPIANTSSTFEDDISGKKKRIIQFWGENPNILLDQKYIFEFFPIETMSYDQKLNAVTRTIIVLTILGFAFSGNLRVLLIGLITMGVVFLMQYYHELEKSKVDSKKEGFISDNAVDYLTSNKMPISNDIFQEPDSSNPFSNILITDYDSNPNKKPAPPAFNENINSKILKEAKQLVVDANPDQPDIADKLFKDLGENLVFEQSMRQFSSNPSTTIPNDQGAFAEFCYGSMISCKEGNNFACARNMPNYTLY
jgi:hypothetical protein